MSTDRNSTIELLRIFCILGILFMHSMGEVLYSITRADLLIATALNSVFNMTSSCLMIISGYFGLKFTVRKYVHLELICVFWSITSLLVRLFTGADTVSRADLVSGLFPVMTSANWFVTGYAIIMIFSGYINDLLDRLDRAGFRKLLITMLILFYAVPTVIYTDMFNTTGKDVIHLLVMYCLGRYIRKYYDEKYNTGLLWGILIVVIIVTSLLNLGAEKIGVRFWFCRDCSLMMAAEAVLFFMIAKNSEFHSGFVNALSGNILSVLLGEHVALFFAGLLGVTSLVDVSEGLVRGNLWTTVILRVICVFLFCTVIEKVRGFFAGLIESRL